jgi:hypothetical protein
MSAYGFRASIIGRKRIRRSSIRGEFESVGLSSAVAAAAYRSATILMDYRLKRTWDFSGKGHVLHTSIMTPDGTPDWMRDRERLWNSVEQREKRWDAQLARELQLQLPRGPSEQACITMLLSWVQTELIDRGMVADIAIHWPPASDGKEQPHAHILASMRQIVQDRHGDKAWGNKVRAWNDRKHLMALRKSWENAINEELMEAGSEIRVSCQSYAARGFPGLRAQPKLGPHATQKMKRNRTRAAISVNDVRSTAINTDGIGPGETVSEGFISEPASPAEPPRVAVIPETSESGQSPTDRPPSAASKDRLDRLAKWRNWQRKASTQIYNDPQLAVALLLAEGRDRFTEKDLRQKLQSRAGGELSTDIVQVLMRRLIRSGAVMPLNNSSMPRDRQFTAPDALNWEHDILARAARMWDREPATNPTDMAPHYSTDPIENLRLDIIDAHLAAVIGPDVPGGKDRLLKDLIKKWHAKGVVPIVATTTPARARDMTQKLGLRTDTIPALLQQLHEGAIVLNHASPLVIDQAHHLSLYDCWRLLEAAEPARSRLVLVADRTRATPETVSPFAMLYQLAPVGDEVTTTSRQTNPLLRSATRLARRDRWS